MPPASSPTRTASEGDPAPTVQLDLPTPTGGLSPNRRQNWTSAAFYGSFPLLLLRGGLPCMEEAEQLPSPLPLLLVQPRTRGSSVEREASGRAMPGTVPW